MEFRFSDEEEDLRKAVADFAQKEVVEKEFDRLSGPPANIIKQMSDLGFLSLNIAPQYGGEPGSWVDIGIIVEEIAKGDINLAYFLMLSYEINLLLSKYGQTQVAEKWVSAVIRDGKIGSIAMTEPDAGCDLGAMKALAVKDGDSYVFSGTKCPVSFGMHADFTILFVPTTTEAGPVGVTAFLVPLDSAGVSRSVFTNSGMHASGTATVTFDKVRVPSSYRLGKEGEGIDLNMRYGLFSDLSQILSALICVGVCQAALKQAVSYSKERTAFGRPIGQFQAVSERIAESATLIEGGKWLCYRALSLKDQGVSNIKEAAMCGWWCPNNAFKIIEEALLIHGHAGYSNDHPHQQWLRDVVAFELIAGTGQMLKQTIAEGVIGATAVPREIGAALKASRAAHRSNPT